MGLLSTIGTIGKTLISKIGSGGGSSSGGDSSSGGSKKFLDGIFNGSGSSDFSLGEKIPDFLKGILDKDSDFSIGSLFGGNKENSTSSPKGTSPIAKKILEAAVERQEKALGYGGSGINPSAGVPNDERFYNQQGLSYVLFVVGGVRITVGKILLIGVGVFLLTKVNFK